MLALPAGHAADRYSRRGLFQLALSLQILASLGLAFVSVTQGPVHLIFLFLLLSGIGRAFGAPSRTALLPQVVPPEALPNAVTWNSSGWQFANVVGPALGGLVVALTDHMIAAYLLSACNALICIVLLTFIRPRPFAPPVGPGPKSFQVRRLAGFLAGVRFVWQSDLLLAAITLDLFAVLLGGATALLPVFARDILQIGSLGLGCLRAGPALGALGMGLILAHRRPLHRPGLALLLSVAGFGAATIVFGFSTNVFLSFAMLVLLGALDNVSVVVRGTLMQMLTPDEMRGRVAAVNTLFISSSNELGAFESGTTADWFGTVASVVGGGAGTILIVLLVMCRWPRLLRLEPLHTLKPAGGALQAKSERKKPSDPDTLSSLPPSQGMAQIL